MSGLDRREPIRHLLAGATTGAPVEVTGWVKTSRFSKNVSFVHLMDGSTPATVQVVLPAELAGKHKQDLGAGAAVRCHGHWVASPGKEQSLEVAAESLEIVGATDPTTYPLQRKRTSLEHLRTLSHLRPRTNTFQAVFRVRNEVCWQIHKYFQERGFLWVHTPLIATSDAEGAGDMFEVTAGANPEGFFGTRALLTVSGQLEAETFAQAFTDVYTFGPTFRAENSNTARHAAEFWMIEPEIAFADLNDVIALAEDFLRTITLATLDKCADDFAFFDKRIEPGVVDAVRTSVSQPFARVTWHEAQEILAACGRTFEFPIGEGTHLQAEHERFLAEEHFKGPVFVTDYPTDQKAFYMRLSDDERTVAATDLLVPRVGELLGGSQREERLDVLDDLMARHDLDPANYEWYRDLRKYGTVPHGGFGVGLERLIMWMTGMKNIRDVLPFPRVTGQAF